MNDKRNIFFLIIIFFIFSVVFYAKTGNMLIDFSREVYVPFQMNNSEKLIKDIFLIYGPFGYILNSLLYKISFSIDLLLLEAHLISLGIIILFYFILKKFLNNNILLFFCFIFIAFSVFSNSTFSFVLPYSYSTLWSIFSVYLVLFCLLYDKKNILFLSLGLILSTKIELFLPVFLISIVYFIYQKNAFVKNIHYILIFPLLCISYILFSGVEFQDIVFNFSYLKSMIKTETIACLYKGMGSFFEINYFKYNILLLIKTFIIFYISYFLYKKNKVILSYLFLLVSLLFINTNFVFNLIFFINLALTLVSIFDKNIKKEEIILFIFAALLCSKGIFAINSINYSNFGYCLMIVYFYLQIIKYIDKKWVINSFIVFFTCNFMSNVFYSISNPKTKIKSKIGNIYINKNEAKNFIFTTKFIGQNLKEDENFIVIPEGQIFNLIFEKKYDFYNSTFIPLDFETFGEKNILDELIKKQTDYVILYPRNTKEYGFERICHDYAVDFCKYIIDNYTQVEINKDNSEVRIFKIKK